MDKFFVPPTPLFVIKERGHEGGSGDVGAGPEGSVDGEEDGVGVLPV